MPTAGTCTNPPPRRSGADGIGCDGGGWDDLCSNVSRCKDELEKLSWAHNTSITTASNTHKHTEYGLLAKASNEDSSKRSGPAKLKAGWHGHVVDESAREHYLSS